MRYSLAAARATGRLLTAALLSLLSCGCSASGSEPRAPVRSAPLVTAPPVVAADTAPPSEPDTDGADEPDVYGTPRRGWLGVELEATPPSQAGVLVRSVMAGSPALRAGIVPGDVILRIEGRSVQSPAEVIDAIGERAAGERVGISFRRGSADRLVAVDLEARPDPDAVQRLRFVGLPAPPLESLQPVRGSAQPTLGAMRGQVLVIEFWSPWCTACRLLIPFLNDWHARFSAQGMQVVAVTTESVIRAAAAARQLGIDHPVMSDETGQTTIAYGAMAVPTLFVIDRGGTVRDVLVGYHEERLAELEALIGRLLAEP